MSEPVYTWIRLFGQWMEMPLADYSDFGALLRRVSLRATIDGKPVWKTLKAPIDYDEDRNEWFFHRRGGNTLHWPDWALPVPTPVDPPNWVRLCVVNDPNDPNWRIEPSGLRNWFGGSVQRWKETNPDFNSVNRGNPVIFNGRSTISAEERRFYRSNGRPYIIEKWDTAIFDTRSFTDKLILNDPTRHTRKGGWYHPLIDMQVRRVLFDMTATVKIFQDRQRNVGTGFIDVPVSTDAFILPEAWVHVLDSPTGALEPMGFFNQNGYPARSPVAPAPEDAGLGLYHQYGTDPFDAYINGDLYEADRIFNVRWTSHNNPEAVTFIVGVRYPPDYMPPEGTSLGHYTTINLSVHTVEVHYAMPGYDTPPETWTLPP